MSQGNVTIEDVPDDEYEYDDADEELTITHTNTATTASSTAAAGAKPKDKGPDNTNRGGLSPGVESQFEVWLRNNVNQPLLDHVVPTWVTPNSISYANTAVCWTALLCSYIAYKYEHVYPVMACTLRIIMGVLIFLGISLDCLDGMQARKTGRCSKLGEVLDHSLDAANVPIIGCCILMTLQPDVYTLMISLVGGNMIYNAQLVIYRHHHVFVLPPVTGPAAQAMGSAASIFFAFFFLLLNRHDNYFVFIFIRIFVCIGNLAQLQNCFFYTKHLLNSFEHSCIMPHIRFTLVMTLHGGLLWFGYLTNNEYMLSAILLAYRLNGKYVLDTLQNFKPFTANHTKADIRAEDTEWRVECLAFIGALWLIALTLGVGHANLDEHVTTSLTGFHPLTDSLYHAVLYGFMVFCVATNVNDIKKAIPTLEAK